MKSSTISSIALISILAASSMAFAQGRGAPSGAGSQSAARTSGIQSRIHTPGTGLNTDASSMKARMQTHISAPGTSGPGTSAPGTGQFGPSNGGRGIHTPGTGLTTTAPVPVPAPLGN